MTKEIDKIERDMIKYGGCLIAKYYPENVADLVVLSSELEADLLWDGQAVYPQISLERFNDPVMSRGSVLALIPSNMVDVYSVLRETGTDLGGVEFWGASNVRIDPYRCPIPKQILIDKLTDLATRRYDSLIDVHEDICSFLQEYYEESVVTLGQEPPTVDAYRSVFASDPLKTGSLLWSMDAAYIFLVTQFCVRNKQINNARFIHQRNPHLRYLSESYYFFSHRYGLNGVTCLIRPDFVRKGGYMYEPMRQLRAYGSGIVNNIEEYGACLVEYNIHGMLAKDFLSRYSENMVPYVPYNRETYVVCNTLGDYDRIKEIYHRTEGTNVGKILESANILFKKLPELKRVQHMGVIKSGGDHLNVRLRDVA